MMVNRCNGTLVKICGLTGEPDILYVNRHLPDYIGFVFAPGRRWVSPQQAKALCSSLDKRIKKAGVFVNESMSNIIRLVEELGLDVVQLHGEEMPEYVSELKNRFKGHNSFHGLSGSNTTEGCGVEVWKAVRVRDAFDPDAFGRYNADGYVLDSHMDGSYGGTGTAFEWKIASGAGRKVKIILAGGLNSGNVGDAIRIVQPFAVDTSSGVETDFKKDELKIKDFISAVRCMKADVKREIF